MIEILVAVSIMGILSIMISQAFFTSVRSNTKTELMKEIKQNGDYAVEILSRKIQNAISIETCNPHSLKILNQDTSETTIKTAEDNGICKIQMDTTYPSPTPEVAGYLTSGNLTVAYTSPSTCDDAVSFLCKPIGSSNRSVTIDFTLEQKGAAQNNYEKASLPYSTTVVLRNINF
jgi:Tfp pilus assembly protein PilW